MLRRRVMMGTKIVDDSDYLTFTALANGTFTLNIDADVTTDYLTSVAYSLDDGATWVTTDNTSSKITITTPTVAAGSTVKWKGIGTAYTKSTSRYSRFSSTGSFSVSGNIMSLLFGDNYKGKRKISKNYAFAYLFYGSKKITDASNLLLPATTLAADCYNMMFCGCTSLTTAPELPATTLALRCYYRMFKNCTNLTTIPELPATTLAADCYREMFYGCTSLTTAPEILPATTLETYCYYEMFYGCTRLATAPELPATTLAGDCYREMFDGCTSLTTAPELPATTLASNCYLKMFDGCTNLTTAPELPATILVKSCYYQMFYDCTKLNSVTCLATNISASDSRSNWLYHTASSGTFTKAAGVSWPTGTSGIPSGWTVVEV